MYNKDAELKSVPLSDNLEIHSQGVDFIYPYGDIIPLTYDKSYVECTVKRINGKEEVLKGYIHRVAFEISSDNKQSDLFFFIMPVEGPDAEGWISSSQWLYANYKNITELKADKRLVDGSWQTIENYRDI